MIAKAIERNVPPEKIAKALDINVRSLRRKATLIDGICEDAVSLLKDKMCPMAIFDVLRKMNTLRQIEAAELLVNANNYSVSYATAILAGTPQAQLANPTTTKRMKGMTAEALARMEGELSRLQQAISSIQDSYGQDHLHLTVVKGYLAKLVANPKVAKIPDNWRAAWNWYYNSIWKWHISPSDDYQQSDLLALRLFRVSGNAPRRHNRAGDGFSGEFQLQTRAF